VINARKGQADFAYLYEMLKKGASDQQSVRPTVVDLLLVRDHQAVRGRTLRIRNLAC
jgi:hypothetical protein